METSGFKTRKRRMREASVEAYLVRKIKELGGLCKKWVCPGSSGEPDRIVILDGIVFFAELKRPGGRFSEVQKVRHEELRRCGAMVETISSKEDVDELIAFLKLALGSGAKP